MTAPQLLDASKVPLTGVHLIEASAGTGKTFNITRLYLRLLLEQQLTVEQILVMTFTKDATQELKGRIDDTLRDALQNWSSLINDDPFYQALSQKVDEQDAKLRLKRALLFIDEASIFTIHGFCQRVLNQYAFNAKLSLDATLSPDIQSPMLQATQDWYRQLAKQDVDGFIRLSEFWSTPEAFLDSFSKALSHGQGISGLSAKYIESNFTNLVAQALNDIQSNIDFIQEALIDVKTGNDREKRQEELDQLTQWLQVASENIEHAKTTIPMTFAHGGRFTKQYKPRLIEIFSNLQRVKSEQKDLSKRVNKAHAYTVVQQGLSSIGLLVEEIKRQQNILNFDDLVEKLANTLANDSALATQLLRDYPVALVDEFQDTDSHQYTIIDNIYGRSEQACVFMIGDPKQAIYGFRGGDVFAYLSAREKCQHQWVMDTNWRSSVGMISGYNRLFYGNELTQASNNVFNYGIDYFPVQPSPRAKEELTCSQGFNALQFVDFIGDGKIKQSQRVDMATWCANEIHRLLKEKPTLQAKDFAVLVRDSGEANQIKDALTVQGLASVFLSNRDNLFLSFEAQQLLTLLKGILHLDNEQLYTSALTTSLLNYHPERFISLQTDEQGWQVQKQIFEKLRDVWSSQGFMPIALQLMHKYFHIENDNKDRSLTNVLHLFELLQEASTTHHLPHELIFWFEQQVEAKQSATEAELRLESDANLIKIITQHGSKGLEYPVVFVPFATRYKDPMKVGSRSISLVEYHQNTGTKVATLGGNEQERIAMKNEAHAEAVRLLYVAITRAEQRCYVMCSQFDNAQQSPLGLTLQLESQYALTDSLKSLALNEPHIGYASVLFEDISPTLDDKVKMTEVDENVQVAQFTSKIERDWWLSSFTALSRNIRHQGISNPDRDETEQGVLNDENTVAQTTKNLRFALTKGAQTGNLLHEMLEYNVFDSPQWLTTLQKNQQRFQEVLTTEQFDALASWLDDILATPLIDDKATPVCLAQLAESDTIKECEFYFPMEKASLTDLLGVLAQHRQDNPYRQVKYNKNIYLPYMNKLKGMMHGFIDLVFQHQGRFYVCDYKSSFLGDDFSHYSAQSMAIHVEDHHYDLQYLIYALALHRYLQQHLADYQPEEHFGGVYYLYLRGMPEQKDIANKTCDSQATGVYYREISHEELEQLDDIFSGEINDKKESVS